MQKLSCDYGENGFMDYGENLKQSGEMDLEEEDDDWNIDTKSADALFTGIPYFWRPITLMFTKCCQQSLSLPAPPACLTLTLSLVYFQQGRPVTLL